MKKLTKEQIENALELCRKSTQVVAWYAHGKWDGYHHGKSSVRGPFGRWFICEGGENKPGVLGEGVADLDDDAEFAASALNNYESILTEVLELRESNKFYRDQLAKLGESR